jgi:7-carboxy-7-deazaguanine synthase
MVTNWETLDFIVDKLKAASVNFTLKVVVFNEEDFQYAKKVDQRYNQPVFYVSVGNEDAYEPGDISGRLIRELDGLWERVLKDPEANHWRPLPQLHTIVWANKRGV